MPKKRKLKDPIPVVEYGNTKGFLTCFKYSTQLEKDKVKLFEFEDDFKSYLKSPRVVYHTKNALCCCLDVLVQVSSTKKFAMTHEFCKIRLKSQEKNGKHVIDFEHGFPYCAAMYMGRFEIENMEDEEDIELDHTWEWYYTEERGRLNKMSKQFIRAYSPKDDIDEILEKLQDLGL